MYIDLDGARIFFDVLGSSLAIEEEATRQRQALVVLGTASV
jgi:hypothetical protein